MSNISIPRHVAVIPDGNRRWARLAGLSAFRGHQRGVKAFRDIAWRAADIGVEYLSFWGISADNIRKRSAREVRGLMRIFTNEFKQLSQDKEVHARRVRIRVIGQWQKMFPDEVKKEILETMRVTKNNQNFNLTLLLAYNGTEEMMDAIKKLAKEKVENNRFRLDAKSLKNKLWTRDLPPVDLVIRTGGEPHLSNGFMMWDTADAELYFTNLLWPEFDGGALDAAVKDFGGRRRRRGK